MYSKNFIRLTSRSTIPKNNCQFSSETTGLRESERDPNETCEEKKAPMRHRRVSVPREEQRLDKPWNQVYHEEQYKLFENPDSLETEYLLYESAFRPHETSESAHGNRIFF